VRAVLDPNVIVSGLLSVGGAPAAALRAAADGDFEMIVSPALLEELAEVLAHPKIRLHVSELDAQELAHWLGGSATLAPDASPPPGMHSRDPDDDYLIGLAASTRAMLVSGDDDLLALANRMPVLTPRAFLEQLGA